MKKKISTVPFQDTPDQHAKLMEAIDELRDQKGCLMPIMQAAQGIYGYLPLAVQSVIARDLGISVEEVISRVEGIRCGFKPTSCPDQLAQALKQFRDAPQD